MNIEDKLKAICYLFDSEHKNRKKEIQPSKPKDNEFRDLLAEKMKDDPAPDEKGSDAIAEALDGIRKILDMD